MWTRGKDKEKPGKFCYELYDASGAFVERVGGFQTHSEADRAAEQAQRALLIPAGEQLADADYELLENLLDAP